jgi:uncharacterized protein (TIGR02231 family)
MVKTLILPGLLLFSFSGFAQQENEKKIKHDIKEVTVFLSGAQVSNSGTITLNPGKWDIIFDKISNYINVNSIQAKGDGDFTILSVSHRFNYLKDDEKPKDIQAVEDSLKTLRSKSDLNRAYRQVYEKEQEMILANKQIGGQNTGVNIAELEKNANFYRNRLMEIQNKLAELKVREDKINESVNKFQKQLTELNSKSKLDNSEIVVSIAAKNPGTAKIQISYLTTKAGWTPSYDIRATDNNSPIKLEYKAHVWQASGVDWKDIKLTLSTGNPSQSGTAPTLQPWKIGYYQGAPKEGSYGYLNTAPSATFEIMEDSKSGSAPKPKKESFSSLPPPVTMSEGQVTTVFDIPIPYTIATSGKPNLVEIQSFTVPATYKYYAAPKLDRDAFLLAKITGWDKLNLIDGDANIFYEGTYVGKSFINTRNITDTLSVSLGRDKNVLVTRLKLTELCEKKTLGTQKKETLVFEINVRNKKKQDIEIEIDDQIPLSVIKEIEVDLTESTGASYDPVTGKLSWRLKLQPGDTKKLKFGFTVKYPKDKVITL